jgi:hypothetical protein
MPPTTTANTICGETETPTCEHCRCRVIGHGVEAGGRIFCCAHCAKEAGVQRVHA